MVTVWRLVIFSLVAASTAGLAWAVRYREPATPPAGVFPDRVDLGPQSFGAIAQG